jgi:thiamine-phosphate pyrophosphorylase
VVFRAFGAPEALATGRRLAKVARRRGLVLLAGADAGLAARLMADGVHLPERLAHRLPGLRRARPGWILTCAAHSGAALAAARRSGADAVFLSPVFESRSPSAGTPMGALRFAGRVRGAGLPVYALGGINARTARLIVRSGAAGVAAIEALTRT